MTSISDCLTYEPVTGQFFRPDGSIAKASADRRGYRRISVLGKQYLAHRLAWLLTHGTWPSIIDHSNGDPSDNRLANLRLATCSQNMANKSQYPSNKTGIRGVHRHPNGKYRVQFTKDGKTLSFGYFSTLDEARQVAIGAARRVHGEFARVGAL